MDSAAVLVCIDCLWPVSTDSSGRQSGSRAAEARVKHAAAAYLVNCSNFRASSSDVAAHVVRNIGSVKQLGIRQSFRQLLAGDPCFVLEDPHASEAYIRLNVQQVVQRGSLVGNVMVPQKEQEQQLQHEQHQQQQQPHQQHSMCITSPSMQLRQQQWQQQQIPGPYAAVNILYSSSGSVDDKIIHWAAKHLIDISNNSSTVPRITAAVEQQLGSLLGRFGITAPLCHVLQKHDIFRIQNPDRSSAGPGTSATDCAVRLDIPLLRTRAAAVIAQRSNSRLNSSGVVVNSFPSQQAPVGAADAGVATDEPSSSLTKHGSSSSLDFTSSDEDEHPFSCQMITPFSTPAGAPLPAPVVAAGSGAAVTARQLLQFVTSRQWHSSNAQLDTVRRALAAHLVQWANSTAGHDNSDAVDGPASDDMSDYCLPSYRAGVVMKRAFKLHYKGQKKCYNSMDEALAGDTYLYTVSPPFLKQHVQLRIVRLLQDVSASHSRRVDSVMRDDSSSSNQGLSALRRASSTGAASAAAAVAASPRSVDSEGATARGFHAALHDGSSSSGTSLGVIGLQQQQQQQNHQQQQQQHQHRVALPAVVDSKPSVRVVPRPATISPSQQLHTPMQASSNSSSSSVIMSRQLLRFVSTRTWHATSPQLDAVRRAVAVHIVQKVNAAQLQAVSAAAAAAAVTDQELYQMTGTQAGPLMLQILQKQFPGQRPCWPNTKAAFDTDVYFSTYKSGVSERSIQLDIRKLLNDIAAAAQPAAPAGAAGVYQQVAVPAPPPPPPPSPSAAAAASIQQTPPPSPSLPSPQPAGAAVSAAGGIISWTPKPPLSPSPQHQQQQQYASPSAATAAPAAATTPTSKKQSGPPESFEPVFGFSPSKPAAAAAGDRAAASPRTATHQSPAGTQLSASSDLSEALQLLGGLTADVCAAAKVMQIPAQQQQYQSNSTCSIRRVVQHILAAKLAAWDFTVSDLSAAKPSASGGSSSSSNRQMMITRVHVFVPPVGTWPAIVYVLDLAAANKTAAVQQMMQQLQPILDSSNTLNVFHDVRQISVLLQQHFRITLTRPLDTQLLAGIAGFAANTAASSSSSSSDSIYVHDPSRPTLQQLLVRHGYATNPTTDGVRHLLLLAQQLLQQVPNTLLAIGDLQVLLAQQQQQHSCSTLGSSLQLQPHLLPGYSPFIPQQGSGGPYSSNQAAASRGASGLSVSGGTLHSLGPSGLAISQAGPSGLVTQQALTQICFELKVQHQTAGGWFKARYDAFMNDSDHAGGAASPSTQLSTSHAAPAAVQQGASPRNGPKVAASGGVKSADATAELDEAVMSMMWLLPARLHPYLQLYSSRQQQPALMEVFIDTSDVVKLRLADKSTIDLDISISIPEALAQLAAAKQLGKQQGATLRQGMQQGEAACSQVAAPSATAAAATQSKGGFFGLFGSSRNGVASSSSSSGAPEAFPAAAAANMQAAAASAAAAMLESLGDAVSSTDTAKLAAACGFGSDNRMGVPGTLHRIAAIRDRQGAGVTGLTYRIGRDIRGVARPLADVLSSCKASLDPASGSDRPRCVLLLGRPGVGKTTLLRNIAYLLSMPSAAGGLGVSVVIVDTSNEIAGDSDERHPCIGTSRRMMVRRREDQADVLIEAVQNHTPDVIIVDEIGTRKEVEAAKTIAQRGVVLIATAHGNTLGDLMRNPTLRDLVGGVGAVTLGDSAAKTSNSGRKTRLERAGAATFNTLVELRRKQEWCVHLDVEKSVDTMLRTGFLNTNDSETNYGPTHRLATSSGTGIIQTRTMTDDGRILVQFDSIAAGSQALYAAAVVDSLASEAAGSGSISAVSAVGASSSRGHVGCRLQGSAVAANKGASQSSRSRGGFSGAWLVDLVHAAVHRAIANAAEGH